MREGSLEAPTRHPVAWEDPSFYDEAQLDAELRRVFDICHGCRRCFNLCDSFPRLFDLIDATPSGELHDVTSDQFKPVVDACTLCDMCFMTKCPYVPPHEFNLDFPHLMLRARAVEAKKNGVDFAVAQLTQTDRNGQIAKSIAALANWATSVDNQLTRPLMEATLGVHHGAELPKYCGKTFCDAAAHEGVAINQTAPSFGRKALLYATCFVNYNGPAVGHAARAVLAKNGIETVALHPSCCGMPQLEQGQIADVVAKARAVTAALMPYVDQGYDIVALTPSCALMLKFEWPLLVPQADPLLTAIKRLAAATYDLSEYVVDIAKTKGLAPGMTALPAHIALHIACHARSQNMGQKAAEMLRFIPGIATLNVLERCSGHGGSWGIMKDNFEVALKVGKPVAKGAEAVVRKAVAANQPAYIASECPLAGTHIMQGLEKLADGQAVSAQNRHPIELMALAYGVEMSGPAH